jgi:Tol biopolymer transport system component
LAGSIWMINKSTQQAEESMRQSEKTTESLTAKKNEKDNSRVLFATNGSQDVYKIKKGDRWVVIFDGKEGDAYDAVASPAFSADGKQFAYSATLDGKTFLVINGVAQETQYSSITEIAFSPDGQQIAYVANKNEKYVVVLNQKEGKEYNEIGALETKTGSAYLIFSSNSKNLAYKVVENQQQFIVVNNQEGKRYDSISKFTFSDDGTQYAYEAKKNGRKIVVVDNKEISNTPDGSTGGSNSGSPDSSDNDYTTHFRNGKKDVHLDPNRLTYPPCTGTSCNF